MDTFNDPLLLAMQFLKSAITILDGAGASADIGAHVDLAICRLGQELAQSDQEGNEARQ